MPDGHLFDDDAVKRISSSVRATEGQQARAPQQMRPQPEGDAREFYIGKVLSENTIEATTNPESAGSIGQGTVELYKWSTDHFVDLERKVTAYSLGEAFPADTWVMLHRLPSGTGAIWIVGKGTTKAKWIAFTLPSRLAPSDSSKSSCTVDDYWGGSNPGSTVTVYNVAASSNYLFWGPSGGKGLAVYDEIEDRYKIAVLEQQALWIIFVLPGALTTSTASVSSCSVEDYWQGKSPGSTVTIHNVGASSNYIFAAASGHKGLACYDEIEDKYRIVQVEC